MLCLSTSYADCILETIDAIVADVIFASARPTRIASL